MRWKTPARQQGAVLVMVLWLLVLLEVLVASQVVTVRVENELTRNQVEALHARSAAEAGLFMAIDLLARQQGKSERLLRTDGGTYRMDYTGDSVLVSVLDEAGKVDLNAASPEMLRSILLSVSGDADKAAQLTDAILDWRDVDQLRREDGAEDDDYLAGGKEYGAKDEYFDNLEELLLVLGMDADIYAKLIAMVTVNTGAKGVNPLVAQRDVLLAIPGAGAREVDEYLRARDKYYMQAQAMPLFPVTDVKYINQGREQLYTIHVQATTPGGAVEKIAVLARVAAQNAKYGGKPYELLSWNANDHSTMLH